MIRLKNITKVYSSDNIAIKALDDISIDLPSTGLVFLLGKSGSGKSSLLNVIGGLDKQTEGEYFFNGKNVSKYTESDMDELRNCYIGFIFQEFNLIENFTVYENVELPLKVQTVDNHVELVNNILKELNLFQFKDRKVNKLSGGQRQRVAIGRALVKNPQVILADEPTGNLDSAMSNDIYSLLAKLSTERLIFVVTHDVQAAYKYADRIIFIDNGKIAKDYDAVQKNYTITVNGEKFAEGKRNEIVNKYTELLEFNDEKRKYDILIEKSEPETGTKKKEDKSFIENISKKFDFRSASIVFFKGINNRKSRYLFTILIFTLTALLLFFGVTLSTYSVPQAVKEYYNQYPTSSYFVYMDVGYTDELSNVHSKQINSGKLFFNNVSSVPSSELVGILESRLISSKDYEYYQEINVYVGNAKINNLIGKMPVEDEIVITDYLISVLNLDKSNAFGSEVILDDHIYKICGYMQTDYFSNNIADKIQQNPFDPYIALDFERMYSVAYISKDGFNKNFTTENYLNIQASNILNVNYFNVYLNTRNSISPYSYDRYSNLLMGRLPRNENEVLISDRYYQEYLQGDDSWVEWQQYTIDLPNLHDTVYCGYYSDYINLYDYYNNGEITIVGIYEVEPNRLYNSDIIINGEIFNSIINDYYKYYYYDSFYLYTETDCNLVVDTLTAMGIQSYEAALDTVYTLDGLLSNLLPYIIIVLIALSLIVLFMHITCISYSISDNSKTIGILRAIGLSRVDTLKTFIIGALVLFIGTVILTLLFSIIGIIIINHVILLEYSQLQFNIIYFNSVSFLCVSLFVFVITFISSAIPIMRLANKHPIELIRNS